MTAVQRTVVLHKRPDYHSFGVYIGEDFPSGIYIVTIEPNSPASHANIQPGDRVLAFNGRMVSTMNKNPKELLIQTAANTQTLTLTIQSTHILEAVNISAPNNLYNDDYQYSSKQNETIDDNLERYIKSLFSDDSLQIVPVSSEKPNEYFLKSTRNTLPSHHHHHHHQHHNHEQKHHHSHQHHRKPRPHSTKEKPVLTNNEQRDNYLSLPHARSIPSMGTSHVMLRNSQTSSKDYDSYEPKENIPSIPINTRNSTPNNIVNRNPEPIPPPQQISNTLPPSILTNRNQPNVNQQPPVRANNRSAPINGEGIREVRLHRAQGFQGFGFHLNYNRVYYIIHRIEKNSPAEQGGLHDNDVVRQVNDQSTENMPHAQFVDIINASSEVVFLVQPFNEYQRANPNVPVNHEVTKPIENTKNDGEKRQNILTRTLTKLKSR
ncbi:unnamed protein product [Adineta steineri]|uniref:PDZ domain-containing protein n=1 Tax=Adineta steineri TaxID=433720 RepID=A0A813NK78_9BILA|nr:unnamed protein product [Adineta steineri]